MANALEHNNLFLMPVWRAIGKSRWLIKARTLPKTVAVTVAILAVLISLVVVPWPFKMRAKGKLLPVDEREVWAEMDGDVQAVHVDHRDQVQAGQLLVEMENTQLDVSIEKNRSQLETTDANIANFDRLLRQQRRELTRVEEERLRGDLEKARLEYKNLEIQQKLYERQKRDLAVLSPADGVVITWKAKRELMSRPVNRGEVLLRVADLSGRWELEVLMPDSKMGPINRAYKAAQEKGEDLIVQFVLMSDTDTTHQGWVKKIGESAEPRGDEGNVVPITVEITDEVRAKLPQTLRPETTVNAKVACGTRPLGYVLFYDLIAFLQGKVFFRIF
jgi:multidrug efflux pump subunit AcrA (membrane-fusion protein)